MINMSTKTLFLKQNKARNLFLSKLDILMKNKHKRTTP